MGSNIKHLLVVLLACLLLPSCFTIEKRLYRDGYYVRKNVSIGATQRSLADRTDSIPASPAMAQVVNATPGLEIISSERPVAFSGNHLPIVKNFGLDTLPSKKHKKDQGLKKFDEKKDVTNPDNIKLSPLAIVGLIVAVGSIALFVVWSGFLVITSLGGAIISLLAKRQIKRNPDKYYGKGIASIAFVINFLIFAFVFALFLFFLLLT